MATFEVFAAGAALFAATLAVDLLAAAALRTWRIVLFDAGTPGAIRQTGTLTPAAEVRTVAKPRRASYTLDASWDVFAGVAATDHHITSGAAVAVALHRAGAGGPEAVEGGQTEPTCGAIAVVTLLRAATGTNRCVTAAWLTARCCGALHTTNAIFGIKFPDWTGGAWAAGASAGHCIDTRIERTGRVGAGLAALAGWIISGVAHQAAVTFDGRFGMHASRARSVARGRTEWPSGNAGRTRIGSIGGAGRFGGHRRYAPIFALPFTVRLVGVLSRHPIAGPHRAARGRVGVTDTAGYKMVIVFARGFLIDFIRPPPRSGAHTGR